MRVRQRLETGFDFDNYQKNFVRSAQDHAKIYSSCCYLNRHLKGFCYNNELQSSKLGLTIKFKFSHGVMMRSGAGVTRGDNEADRRVVMCHVTMSRVSQEPAIRHEVSILIMIVIMIMRPRAGNTLSRGWSRLILGFIVSKEERNVEIWSGVFRTISTQVFLWVPDDSSSLTMIFLTNDSMTSWLEFIII